MFDYRKKYQYGNSSVEYFVTDRIGGVSEGHFGTLNLGRYAGDDEDNVKENRRRVCAELGISPSRFVVPKEVHGDQSVWVNSENLSQLVENEDFECDALITTEPNLVVGVTTADCVPILVYSADCKVVAAVHAGWKGVIRAILPKTIAEVMEKMHVEAKDLHVVVNPCISLASFEVGEEVAQQFEETFGKDACVVDRTQFNKPHVDLPKAVAMQIRKCGVPLENVEMHTDCTMLSERFYSARREGFHSGRMVSGIFITRI